MAAGSGTVTVSGGTLIGGIGILPARTYYIHEQNRTILQQELLRIWEVDKKTVLFITHSVDEALVLGNKIAVMTQRPGRIRELITFDVPRPRDITDAEFNDVKRHVLGLIREEGRRRPTAA